MQSPLACQGEKNQNETERWSSDKAHEVGIWELDSPAADSSRETPVTAVWWTDLSPSSSGTKAVESAAHRIDQTEFHLELSALF